MRCPKCDSKDLIVANSRPHEKVNGIYRRRECQACGHRFTTYEIIFEPKTGRASMRTHERIMNVSDFRSDHLWSVNS